MPTLFFESLHNETLSDSYDPKPFIKDILTILGTIPAYKIVGTICAYKKRFK